MGAGMGDRQRQAGASLSERLLVVLTREMDALERASKAERPRKTAAGDETAEANGASAGAGAGAKARIEAIGQMTRTFEKLLELKRLEALAARGDDESEDGEAARLREEMLKRLKALDARRRAGATLFGILGATAGEGGDAGRDGAAASVVSA